MSHTSILFLRALLAFLMLPGMVAFVLPVTIGAFDPWRGAGTGFGLAVLLAGIFLLFWCVRDFYVAGKGTLAPWDPPQQLVVVGLYRYSRNPMYVAVLTIITGWSLWLGSWLLAGYAACFAVISHLRVVAREEPWLARTFGEDWLSYMSAVPRWFIR